MKRIVITQKENDKFSIEHYRKRGDSWELEERQEDLKQMNKDSKMLIRAAHAIRRGEIR